MIELRCKGIIEGKKCDRFLKVTPKGTFIAEVTCADRKCKHVNQIKVVTSQSSKAELRYKFEETTNE
jgi:hypothetical protein